MYNINSNIYKNNSLSFTTKTIKKSMFVINKNTKTLTIKNTFTIYKFNTMRNK